MPNQRDFDSEAMRLINNKIGQVSHTRRLHDYGIDPTLYCLRLLCSGKRFNYGLIWDWRSTSVGVFAFQFVGVER